MADELVLLIDDSPGRRELARHYYPNLILCESLEAAKELLELNSWGLVSLDFTLDDTIQGDDTTGGMALAGWIADNKPDVAQFRIHGHASPGSPRMANVLLRAGYEVLWLPWGEETPRLIQDDYGF